MKRTIYHELLALDLFYNILTWEERILLHLIIAGKSEGATVKILEFLELIKNLNWKSPEKMVLADYDPQDTYYKVVNKEAIELHPIENYKILNPEITEIIEKYKL